MTFRLFALLAVFLTAQMFAVAEDHHGHDDHDHPNHNAEKEQAPIKNEKDEHGHDHDHKEEKKEKDGEPGHHEDHEDPKDHEGEAAGEKEHGHDEEESTGGVGPNNAVTAADEHDGIKLAPKAVQFIGLKTAAYDGHTIPSTALVFYQTEVGIYRLRDGWFKLVPAKDLRAGDQIVIEGVGLLRVAELDAFSGEVGHSH